MSEELKHQESISLGVLLSIIDGSVNPTFRNAPSPEAALETLQELAKRGPIHPGALTRIYMEGQNALFLQLGNILRSALSVSGWDIDGTILEPMSPVAAQHRQELYDRMEQLAKEAAAAAQAEAAQVEARPPNERPPASSRTHSMGNPNLPPAQAQTAGTAGWEEYLGRAGPVLR